MTVFAGGPDGKSVLGYHASTGDPVWYGGDGQLGYSSPHPAKLGGVEQVLMATEKGLTAFEPAGGERSVEARLAVAGHVPRRAADGPRRLRRAARLHHRRAAASRQPRRRRLDDGGSLDQRRASNRSSTIWYVDKDHLYGFDGVYLTCVSLEDGKGRWRTPKYAAGQVLLLADQDLLLVLSEQGDAALVEAKPETYKEIGRFKALEGKTWNHPVVAHGKLFVRNGEEAACYQLTEEGRPIGKVAEIREKAGVRS